MRSEKPVVSVVMIFLNGEKFIREAIDSIVTQTYPGWELMLVDDGSSDKSTEIARSYAEQYPTQIIYLEHPNHRNRGMSASRNLGIQHCNGKYVAFLDCDDVWLPHKLERQVAIMESQPRAAMVYGGSRYWYSWSGNPEDLGRDYIPEPGVPTETLFEPPALVTRLYPFGPATTPPPSDFLVRREALEAVGGFEESFQGIYQLYDDQAFLIKMYLHAASFVSSEEWDKYRIHPDSCDSAATRGGHYDSIRAFFLNWFESYLRHNKITDPAIWLVLQEAVQSARIQLRADGGSVAHLLREPEDPERVRIVIEQTPAGNRSDVQLNRPFYKLSANSHYTIRFKAKADHARNVAIGVAAAHAPWTSLGLYQQIELVGEWRSFELKFVAAVDDDNARIHFDLGEDSASVEIAALSLSILPGDRLVEPGLALLRLNS